MTEDTSQPNNSTTDITPPAGSGGVGNASEKIVRWTAVLTLIIKLFGLGMAANEAFLVDPPRDPVILGLAAFMMAGATGIDSFVNVLLGNKNNQ